MAKGFTNRFLARSIVPLPGCCVLEEHHANLQDVLFDTNLSTHTEKHVAKKGSSKQEQLRIHDTSQE